MPRPGRDKSVSDLEILEAAVLTPGPAVSTTELGDLLGMSQQGIYNRLIQLQEDGLLESKVAGGTRLWWVTFSGEEFVARRRVDGYEDA